MNIPRCSKCLKLIGQVVRFNWQVCLKCLYDEEERKETGIDWYWHSKSRMILPANYFLSKSK